MVTDTMCDEDILNLARVLRERDEGFIEITQATGRIKDDLAFVEKLAGRSATPDASQRDRGDPQGSRPSIKRACAGWRRCAPRGCRSSARPAPIALAFAFTLEHWNLYDSSRYWREMTTGTKEEKLPRCRIRELREGVKSQQSNRKLEIVQAGVGGRIPTLIVQWVNDQPELEKYVGKSLGQIGEEEGKHPIDVMLDLSIATGLKAEFLGPNHGFNAEFTAEMINNSPYTFPGVSDGGAHTKFFSGGAFTTDFLCWMVRDEQRMYAGGSPLSPLVPAGACGRFPRPRLPARRRLGRRRGL